MASETHVEPFVHLADVTPDTALVAGGNLREELRPASQKRVRRPGPSRRTRCSSTSTVTLSLTPVSGLRPDGLLEQMTARSPEGAVVAPPWVVRQR